MDKDKKKSRGNSKDDYVKYKLIMENANSLICELDHEGMFVYTNKTYKRLLGYDSGYLSGITIFDIVHPEDIETLKKKLKKALLSDKPSINTWRFKDSGSEYRYFNNTINTFLDNKGNKAIVIISDDITGQIQIRKELRKSESRYRILASNIPECDLYLFDKDHRYILADGTEMRRHGMTKEYFEGKTVNEAWNKEMHKVLHPVYKAALEGTDVSREFTYEGESYYIQAKPVINDDNEVYAGMALVQNITEDRNIRENLVKAMKKAEEANRQKSEFIANISHEIRTPLNAICGFTEQLFKTDLSEQQENYLNIIDKSSEHLLSLVNQVLEMSKIESGEIILDHVPFRLNKIIEEIYKTMKVKAEQKGLDLIMENDNKHGVILKGDPVRLKQILINLAGNAIKFTDKGYVKIQSCVSNIPETDTEVEIKISDTGVGIPDDHLDTIFDQYKQGDSRITRKFGGTGLGLTISKKYTQMMNGNISVQSKTGKGTTFTLKFKFERGSEQDMMEDNKIIKIVSDQLKNIKLLLVDDDSVNRMLGEVIFKQMGINYDLACDGEEALKKTKKTFYDIILLDIHMPGLSGMDVTRKIRENEKNNDEKKTMIVAVTANVIREDIKLFLKSGMDDYLLKPFKENDLINKIYSVLNLKKQYIKEIDTEEPVYETNDNPLYSLYELKRITGNDNGFMIRMLDEFIKNNTESISLIKEYVREGKWSQIGELAHKMIPSCKHLQVSKIVDDLEELENKTLKENYTNDLSPLTDRIINVLDKVIKSMEKEKQQLIRTQQ